MKKFFTFLLIVLLIGTASSCVSSRRIVGDEYIVVSVKRQSHYAYQTKYYIEAIPVNKKAQAHTLNGNRMHYYTNTFYSVGDTIKLSNCNQSK